MDIKPRVENESAAEKEIRVWFSSRARDPDFLREMAAVAQDMLMIKRMAGATAKTDRDSVIFALHGSTRRIAKSRWSYFVKRGYVSQTVRPTLSPNGERMLKLYAYLLHESNISVTSF